MNNETISQLIAECYIKFHIPVDCTWDWNYRTLRKAGVAYLLTNRIEFSHKFFHHEQVDEKEQKNTVIHEACHLIAFKLYKDKGHGRGWKYCMRVCGLEPKRCHNHDFFAHKKENVVCGCGLRTIGPTQYKRLVNKTKIYGCPECNQKIELISTVMDNNIKLRMQN